nr:MAG TPA: holin protein [Caudoviricetes sp.]
MDSRLEIFVTIICSVIASSGFWTCMQKITDKKDVKTQMLIGLAHDRIVWLGMQYVERGWITQDEYENLYEYLYKPYEKMGGNGSAKRIMQAVNNLPIHKSSYTKGVTK